MGGKQIESGGSEFAHRPLAGLAALRSQLPAGEAVEPTPEPATTGGGGAELGGRIVVQRERKRRGGKTVTRISGLEVEAPSRAALAKELARALGCGTSVDADDILLQGAQVERAAQWLEQRGATRVIRGN